MPVVFLKSIILFFLVLIVVRIMGKRQLGEMQPFELVITIILAEVACIPMNDPYIPLYYGVIPLVTLGTLHLVLSVAARKSMRLRRIMSGNPVIAVDKKGIRYDNLKKLNLNVNDLLESIRSAGYADFNAIAYAIFETNGKLCVIEQASDPTRPVPALLPIPLFIDGAWQERHLATAGLERGKIEEVFRQNGYAKPKDILYADIRQDGLLYVNPKYGAFFTQKLKLNEGGGW
jgi:uncharacterized membrane protein YcaP (DUF421 family)